MAAFQPTFSSHRLNALARGIGAQTYVEIGVWMGDTFHNVEAPLRVGVDPDPLFDWKASLGRNTHFHPVTSDRFFSSGAAVPYRFDLAFIDGLHEYQQTLRDFLAVLAQSGPRAIWVIDDTHPSDFFSALPSQGQAFNGRAQYGNNSQAWHGDVFKVVFTLHDFFPNLSFCTISTGGNPATLVWREPRAKFKPRFKSLEGIGRSDYFAFADNLDLFNLMPEPEAIARVIEGANKAAGAG
jgi:hypothetical protein